jgi:hypothetical protein
LEGEILRLEGWHWAMAVVQFAMVVLIHQH